MRFRKKDKNTRQTANKDTKVSYARRHYVRFEF